MRKFITFAFACIMAISITACGSQATDSSLNENSSVSQSVESPEVTLTDAPDETPTEVAIKSFNGNGEEVDLTVPYNPQRVAILDMASLDIIDALGMGERVVGTAGTSLPYLQTYITEDIVNLGTIKEADLEAVMECEPDVIFIGGRLSKSYDALSEIAPVIYLSTDAELGVVESVRKNAATIATIFGQEEKVDSLMAGFNERIAKLAEFAKDKNAIVGLVTSGSFNVLGNDCLLYTSDAADDS